MKYVVNIYFSLLCFIVDAKSSYARWLKASREERNDDFAPPSFYYDTEAKVARKNDKETRKSHLL